MAALEEMGGGSQGAPAVERHTRGGGKVGVDDGGDGREVEVGTGGGKLMDLDVHGLFFVD